jgi:hypothetical protein
MTSRTLTEAVQGLVGKLTQIATDGVVAEVRADGTVYVAVKGQIHQVAVSTDQALAADMDVELVRRHNSGTSVTTYTMLGSSGTGGLTGA